MNALICTGKREYFLHITLHLCSSCSSAGYVPGSHTLLTYEVSRPGCSSYLLESEKLHSKCQVLAVESELIHEFLFLLVPSQCFAGRYDHSYCLWVMCPYPKYLPVPIARADTGQGKERCYYNLLFYNWRTEEWKPMLTGGAWRRVENRNCPSPVL